MKSFNAANPWCNRILGIVYLPLVFFCYLGLMAGERAVRETDFLIILACYLLGYGLFTVSLTTYPALIFSGRCFAKGKLLWGHLLRWYPLWMIPAVAFVYEVLMLLAGG